MDCNVRAVFNHYPDKLREGRAAKFASSYVDEAALYITVSAGLKWQHSRWF